MFREVQHFRQVWLWVLIVAVTIIPLIVIIRQLYLEGSPGSNPKSLWVIIFVFVILFSVIALLWTTRLETRITPEGVYFRFMPFHLKERHIKWSEIGKAYVRQYKPIGEYGGWGIRGLSAKNRAYNVSGNMGLQLELKNGNKLLIGTQEPGELERMLKIFLQTERTD